MIIINNLIFIDSDVINLFISRREPPPPGTIFTTNVCIFKFFWKSMTRMF